MGAEAMLMPALEQRRVWSSKQIFWGSVLGGFLGGIYFFSENYKALGYPQLAKKALIAALVGSMSFFMVLFLLPDEPTNYYTPFFLLAQCVLVGGYIINEHSKAFNGMSYNKQVFIGLPILAMLIMAIPYYFSESWSFKIPNILCALVQALTVQTLAQMYQDAHIKGLIEKGSKKGTVAKLLGIGVLALLFQLCIVFGIALLSIF